MAKGKKTGGRKAGTPNKASPAGQARLSGLAQVIAATIPGEVFEGDAHALLTWAYKNSELPINYRLEAAGKAIQYEKPRLASIEHRGKAGSPIELLLKEIDGQSRGLPLPPKTEKT